MADATPAVFEDTHRRRKSPRRPSRQGRRDALSIAAKYQTTVEQLKSVNNLARLDAQESAPGSSCRRGRDRRAQQQQSAVRARKRLRDREPARRDAQILRKPALAGAGFGPTSHSQRLSAMRDRAARLHQPAACSRDSRVPPSSASTPIRFTSRSTSASGCPSFGWSDCPTPACARAAIACARRFAIQASTFPSHRITINLAPADVRKAGSAFDLPIALGILAAEGVVTSRGAGRTSCSSASCRSTARFTRARGVLPIAAAARRRGATALLLPAPNAAEAAVVGGLRLLPVRTLREAVDVLNQPPIAVARRLPPLGRARHARRCTTPALDLARPARPGRSRGARSRSRRPAATTC